MDLRDFSPAIKYGAKLQNSSLDSGKILIGDSSNLAQEVTPSGAFTVSTTGVATLGQGVPFVATASVGTVAAIAGVTLLADSVVTGIASTAKVYLQGFTVSHSPILAMTATTGPAIGGMIIQDSVGTAFFTILAQGSIWIGGSDWITNSTGTARITYADAYTLGTGGSAGRGIQVKRGSGSINAGTYLTATAWGVIK